MMIIQLTEKYKNQLIKLMKDMVYPKYRGILPTDVMDKYAYTNILDVFVEDNFDRCYIECFDDEVVSYSIFKECNDHIWIDGIGVLEMFRRKSYASHMLAFIVSKAVNNKLGAIKLDCFEKNKKAMDFYSFHQFKLIQSFLDKESGQIKHVLMKKINHA